MKLTIGSRGSQLALWQANWVKGELERRGYAVAIEIIKTTGDKITDVPLAKVGTKGLFTKEIEEALIEGRVDLAVHSLKDLPTELPAGLALGAVPPRENPRDVLISRQASSIHELPANGLVGTSSLRRSAQLRYVRPDLRIDPLRGNLDTRIRKLEEDRYDAIILAAAGLRRLGWEDKITAYIDPNVMCPAVAQGALGIEIRDGDARTAEALATLDDRGARLETRAERTLLSKLGGGCQVPIGGHARASGDGRLRLAGVVAAPDASRLFRAEASGDNPEDLGAQVAEELLQQGAGKILADVYGETAPIPQQP